MVEKKGKPAPKKEEFVTAGEFKSSMEGIVNALEAINTKLNATPEQAKVITAEEKKVNEAGPDRVQTNPEWEKAAKEILGDFLDHTEVNYEKSGGIMFTIVVARDKSNAGEQYLGMTGSDRRTKEVSATGMEGVNEWCKLVKSNLQRPH